MTNSPNDVIAETLYLNNYRERWESRQGAKEVLADLESAGYVVIERPSIDTATMMPSHPPARSTDPVTSHRAAEWKPRRSAIAFRLLAVHGDALYSDGEYQGFTNAEVARAAGMLPTDTSCPHKRHGELEEMIDKETGINRSGYLETLCIDGKVVTRRDEDTGEDQVVRVLTVKGVALYREYTGKS